MDSRHCFRIEELSAREKKPIDNIRYRRAGLQSSVQISFGMRIDIFVTCHFHSNYLDKLNLIMYFYLSMALTIHILMRNKIYPHLLRNSHWYQFLNNQNDAIPFSLNKR